MAETALRCKRWPRSWDGKTFETDWRSVVGRKDIDIVDIATPNALHAEQAIAAAQAGEIVFCEKPLAMNLEEAQRMTDAAQCRPSSGSTTAVSLQSLTPSD